MHFERFFPFFKSLPGVFKTVFANFFDALSPLLPNDMEKSPKFSASVLLLLTNNDFFD